MTLLLASMHFSALCLFRKCKHTSTYLTLWFGNKNNIPNQGLDEMSEEKNLLS